MGFEPMISVLQDPAVATAVTLARLPLGSVQGSGDPAWPGGYGRPSVFRGRATDDSARSGIDG